MRSSIIEPKSMKKRRPRRARKNPNGTLRCPQSVPSLELRSIGRGSMLMAYAGADGKMRKPTGSTEMQLFIAIGSEHKASVAEARYYRKYTRHVMRVEFDKSADGQVATFYGRWASQDGETGPWSEPLSVRIVGR